MDQREHRILRIVALTTAVALGATAVLVARRSRREEINNPPTGKFIEVEGIRLHYIEKGQGPPVVLLHGNGTMAEDFVASGVVEQVARNYRALAIDRPGYGYSDRPRDRLWTPRAQADLLAKAFERLGILKPVVVGHSWGTLVALGLAIDHPKSVGALLLLSGYYFPTPRLDVALFAPPAIPVIGDILRYTISPLIGRALAPKLIRKMFAPRPVPTSFSRDFPIELTIRPKQIRASAEEAAFMIPAAAGLRGRYHSIEMPVTLASGAADRVVDVEKQSLALYRKLPHAELHIIPGVGHMMHYGSSERIVEFIDGLMRARADSLAQTSATIVTAVP